MIGARKVEGRFREGRGRVQGGAQVSHASGASSGIYYFM